MAFASINQASVGGGSSNALSIQSDGIFMPRLSTAQRTALALTTSDNGLTVYDFTLNNLFIWNGTAWESIPGSGDAGANGSVQYNDNGIVSGASNFIYDKATGLVTGVRYTSTSSSAALPSYAVTAGNGIYNSGANQVGFAINSVNAMTLNSTGLGIGTATPTQKLSVDGAIDFKAYVAHMDNFAVYAHTSDGTTLASFSGYPITFRVANTERMRIDTSGNLLVGTASGSFRGQFAVASGADRNVFTAQVTGGSNGFQVLWNHATTTTRVIIANIPTSSAGLTAGTLWNDAGTIKIA